MDRLIHAIRESLDVAHNLSAAHILLGGMQSAIRDLLDVWACGDDVARERPEICAEHEERKRPEILQAPNKQARNGKSHLVTPEINPGMWQKSESL
ncbi:MAG: hypothetical protein PVH41_15935 [Anaerolineae bacterium]|jgi:hypothetical protein